MRAAWTVTRTKQIQICIDSPFRERGMEGGREGGREGERERERETNVWINAKILVAISRG